MLARTQKRPGSIRGLGLTETILIILAAWALLAFVNREMGERLRDIVEVFPLSLFAGPRIVWLGIPYAAAFVVLVLFGLRCRMSASTTWLIGLALIVVGNLIQGGLRMGFLAPLQFGPTSNYLREAQGIHDWRVWLHSFNTIQGSLFRGARTHPPFAILLFHVLRTPSAISAGLVAFTSSSVVLFSRVLARLGAGREEALTLALLFAVVPAVNVYGAVSIDGVILAASTLFLVGLAGLIVDDSWSWGTSAAFAAGLLAANLLTFGGLFLVAVALVAAARAPLVRRALLLTLAPAAVLYVVARLGFGYDHVRAFMAATRSENPHGFLGFVSPLHYCLTRLEDAGNIAVFLSVPVLAVLVRRRPHPIALVSLAVLTLMLLTGAYRTGETARACLFVAPFLLLTLKDLPLRTLRILVAGAALQTLTMQVLGSYGY